METCENRVAQLRTDINLFQSEIIEEVLTRTDRLNKRMQSRMKREDEAMPQPANPAGNVRFYGGKSRGLMRLPE